MPAAKVLFCDHETECGGGEISMLELLASLDRARFEPHLVCSAPGPLAERAKAAGAKVHFVPMRFDGAGVGGKLRKLFGLRRAVPALERLIRDLSIQLVHTNTLIAGYVGLRAARRAGVPAVWHLRDLAYPRTGRWACARADRVVANSKATAAASGVAEPRSVVIYNGVDSRFFEAAADDRDQVRQELGLGDELLVGVVGRLVPWKGHEEFLRAIAQLPNDLPAARFVVVGDVLFEATRQQLGDYRGRLQRLAAELGIGGRVTFLGNRSDMPRVMAALDVLVHPSRQPEPFGRSIAEAQACGKPVIGTRAGGIPELIEDGVTGLLVPPGQAAPLAEAMARLLVDGELRQRIGAAARELATQRFTVARHVQQVQDVYNQLQAGRDQSPASNAS